LRGHKAARPQLEIREVEWEHDKAGIGLVRVQGQAQDWLVRDRVNYVSLTQDGRLMNTGSGSDLSAYAYWVNMADPLHFGSFAGLPTKFLWFGFGLILCGIILTGTWLHARRLARHPKGPSKASLAWDHARLRGESDPACDGRAIRHRRNAGLWSAWWGNGACGWSPPSAWSPLSLPGWR